MVDNLHRCLPQGLVGLMKHEMLPPFRSDRRGSSRHTPWFKFASMKGGDASCPIHRSCYSISLELDHGMSIDAEFGSRRCIDWVSYG